MENSIQKAAIFIRKDSITYNTDAIVSKTIMKQNGGNVTLFAFDQGQALSEHTAPFDALIDVLDGEAEILINKQSYLLKAGESIIMPANIPHAVNAIKKFKMSLTMVKA